MKHEESNVRPPRSLVELDGVMARVTLTDPETVNEYTDSEGNPVFIYDQYIISRPYRPELATLVGDHFDEWLAMAKAEDYIRVAAENRARRNLLLAETDKEMCVDRMGLEVGGGTITTWLAFLKKFGEYITGPMAQYRKALRDITNHPNWPYLNVEDWPKPPNMD